MMSSSSVGLVRGYFTVILSLGVSVDGVFYRCFKEGLIYTYVVMERDYYGVRIVFFFRIRIGGVTFTCFGGC